MDTVSLPPAHFWSGNSTPALLQLCDGSESGQGRAAPALLVSAQAASLEGQCSTGSHQLPIPSSCKQGECLVRVNKARRLLQETYF